MQLIACMCKLGVSDLLVTMNYALPLNIGILLLICAAIPRKLIALDNSMTFYIVILIVCMLMFAVPTEA